MSRDVETGEDWVVVTDESQVSEAVEFARQGQELLAITPPAYYSLCQSVDTVYSVDTFTDTAELKEYTDSVGAIAADICESLAADFRRQYPDTPAYFKPFEAIQFDLARLLSATAHEQYELEVFLDAVAPSSVRYWEPDRVMYSAVDLRSGFPLLWNPGESPILELLDAMERPETERIQVQQSGGGQDGTSRSTVSRIKDALKRVLNGNRTLGFRKKRLEYVGRPTGDETFVIFEHNPFVWGFVDYAVSEYDSDVDYWPYHAAPPVSLRTGRSHHDPGTGSERLERWSREQAHRLVDTAWNQIVETRYPGPAFREVVSDRLKRYVYRWIPAALDLYRRVRQYGLVRSPTCGLGGPVYQPGSQVFRQALNAAGTPVASFQHGGGYGYAKSPYQAAEALNDFFCGFGPKSSARIASLADKTGKSITGVTIGVNRLRAKYDTKPLETTDIGRATIQSDGIPTLLYVSNGLNGSSRWGSSIWPSDMLYFRHQKELLHLLAEVDDVNVVLKTHYKSSPENPIVQYVEDTALSETVDVVDDRPFTTVLPDSDLVLLDRPTTTLLESMLLNKYIIHLDLSWYDWYPDAKALFEQSVICVDRDNDWQSRIRREIARAVEGNMQDYTEFITQFCSPEYRPDRLWNALEDHNRHNRQA